MDDPIDTELAATYRRDCAQHRSRADEAIAKLLTRHRVRIAGVLWNRLRHMQDVEDCFGNLCLKFMQFSCERRQSLFKDSIAGLLVTSASNAAIDFVRDRNKRLKKEGGDPRDANEPVHETVETLDFFNEVSPSLIEKSIELVPESHREFTRLWVEARLTRAQDPSFRIKPYIMNALGIDDSKYRTLQPRMKTLLRRAILQASRKHQSDE